MVGAKPLWCVILAGGEGRRLLPLTERLYGFALPKQFATFARGRSLLQETVLRLRQIVPERQMVVVVPSELVVLALEQLAFAPLVHVVAQPKNLGTAVGLALGLSHVLLAAPDAIVLVSPVDHDIPMPRAFFEAASSAVEAARSLPLVLIGARPDHAETEYGWIVPGRPIRSGVRAVARFVEKPDAAVASELMALGGLWNTLTFAASARVLSGLLGKHVSALHGAVSGSAHAPCERRELDSVYASMPPADFSRDVLERARGLGVVELAGSEWSDWGTPARVLASLEARGRAADLLARCRTGVYEKRVARRGE